MKQRLLKFHAMEQCKSSWKVVCDSLSTYKVSKKSLEYVGNQRMWGIYGFDLQIHFDEHII